MSYFTEMFEFLCVCVCLFPMGVCFCQFFCRWFCVGGGLIIFFSPFLVNVGDCAQQMSHSTLMNQKTKRLKWSNTVTTKVSVIIFQRTCQSENEHYETEFLIKHEYSLNVAGK